MFVWKTVVRILCLKREPQFNTNFDASKSPARFNSSAWASAAHCPQPDYDNFSDYLGLNENGGSDIGQGANGHHIKWISGAKKSANRLPTVES